MYGCLQPVRLYFCIRCAHAFFGEPWLLLSCLGHQTYIICISVNFHESIMRVYSLYPLSWFFRPFLLRILISSVHSARMSAKSMALGVLEVRHAKRSNQITRPRTYHALFRIGNKRWQQQSTVQFLFQYHQIAFCHFDSHSAVSGVWVGVGCPISCSREPNERHRGMQTRRHE